MSHTETHIPTGLVKKGQILGFSRNDELKIELEHGELKSGKLKEKQPFSQIKMTSELYSIVTDSFKLYSTH